MSGEILEQLDLFVAKRTYHTTVDANRAYQFLILEHRHDYYGPHPGKFGKRGSGGVVLFESWIGQIRYMNELFGRGDLHQWTGTNNRFASSKLGKGRGSIVHRDDTECFAFA